MNNDEIQNLITSLELKIQKTQGLIAYLKQQMPGEPEFLDEPDWSLLGMPKAEKWKTFFLQMAEYKTSTQLRNYILDTEELPDEMVDSMNPMLAFLQSNGLIIRDNNHFIWSDICRLRK